MRGEKSNGTDVAKDRNGRHSKPKIGIKRRDVIDMRKGAKHTRGKP